MGTFYKLCTENHHCHCQYSQKLGQSTAMTADGWFKAWQGSGGSLLPRGQCSSNIQNLPQAAITVCPNGTSGERTGGSCKLPGHGAFTCATAAQAVMPVARWLSSVDGFQWSPCKLLRCFQRGWHQGLSVSSAFRSTNDANRFLAVCHRDMADTPRSFSKQDKAFPRYLNLVEGCFTLTLPDSSSLRVCEQQTTTRGEYWSWREKKERCWQAAVPGGSDRATDALILALCPCWGRSCRIRLRGKAWSTAARGLLEGLEGSVAAGGNFWAHTTCSWCSVKAGCCGSAKTDCVDQTMTFTRSRSPSPMFCIVPCPQRLTWDLGAAEPGQPAPVVSKRKAEHQLPTGMYLRHTCIFTCASPLTL